MKEFKVYKDWQEFLAEEKTFLRRFRPHRPKKLDVDPEGLAFVESVLACGGRLSVQAIREAIGSGAWDSIMLDAMHKKLLKGYSSIYAITHWPKLVSNIANVSDFKTQYAIQLGDFTSLDKVPAGGPYFETSFTDDRVSYTVAKYGNTFPVSFEALTNDDLGVLTRVSDRFGRAAARTLETFVLSTLIDANPTIYDGNNLFDSTNHGNDLGSSCNLTRANLETAKTKFRLFTDPDGNKLNIRPKYLIVDPTKEWVARRLLESPDDPETANRAINVHKGSLELIVSGEITTNAWYLVADPAVVDTIEIGFLGGRREPELWIEDPRSGHAFTYDERRIRARLVFGGVVLDYRGFVRAGV